MNESDDTDRRRNEHLVSRRLGIDGAKKPIGVMTPEEVTEMISSMAKGGDGINQRWALGMMRKMTAEQTVLPPPLDEREVLMRLARLLKGYGEIFAKRALEAAFPKSTTSIELLTLIDDGDPARRDFMPHSLSELWQRFPEKQPTHGGYPKGYPYRGTKEDQKEWVVNRCKRLMFEERKKQLAAARAEKNKPKEATDGQSETLLGQ